MHKKSRTFSFKIAVAVLAAMLACAYPPAARAAVTPDSVFTGDPGASVILKNLDYQDVKGSNTWAKEAIYESGALGIMKGMQNMNRRFGLTDTLTKQEALAIAYRAAGREAEAQTLGESLNAARAAANKKSDPLEIWYDGYLQLAANEGLISAQDLADALNTDPTALTAASFRRTAPAQRQELAYWLASALKLAPVRGQQDIFNNYVDWRSADPEKIPYIETILQDGIMNGNGSGRFNPALPVTREQAAQVVKNAEQYVLEAFKYLKNTGMVENISTAGDYSTGVNKPVKNIDIRNTSGKLDRITVTSPLSPASGKNEQAGTPTTSRKNELAVYKNGAVGDSSLIIAGDRLEYITSSQDSTVKYVKVISNAKDVRYIAAQVNGVDAAGLLIDVFQLFNMDFPNLDTLKQDIRLSGNGPLNSAFRYSRNTAVEINGAKASIGDITPGLSVILTVTGNNIVTAIQSVDLGINSEEKYVVRGIVEENNPQLGYITLYNEDGTGMAKGGDAGLAALRTYNYASQNKLEVFRNHAPLKIDGIQPGDTAYLRLDADGNVTSVSAVDNYVVKYGRILSVSAGGIAVQFEDGVQQLLDTDNALVIQDGKAASVNSLEDGDNVRLLLNITEKSTDLKEITIEGSEHYISNIYKGIVSNIDDTSDKLSILNLQSFDSGAWERTDRKGFTTIPLADGFRIYADGKQTDINTAKRLLNSNEAYIAVESDYGGAEKAVILSYRNRGDTEVLYADGITNAVTGSRSFGLAREYKQVGYGAGSIIVKYGRLVSGNSLADDDQALMALNRDSSGDFNAGVVRVDEPQAVASTAIYRARISNINDNRDFTVESYSRLSGSDWIYYNTAKTFRLAFDTRMLGTGGLLNVRDFTGVGPGSSIGNVVYILADGTDAKLISTAPYGPVNIRGVAYDIKGAGYGDEGTLVSEPDGLVLDKVKIYDPTDLAWDDSGTMTLNILENSMILKDGKAIKASKIKKGDTLSIMKKDASLSGDAYIIMVE